MSPQDIQSWMVAGSALVAMLIALATSITWIFRTGSASNRPLETLKETLITQIVTLKDRLETEIRHVKEKLADQKDLITREQADERHQQNGRYDNVIAELKSTIKEYASQDAMAHKEFETKLQSIQSAMVKDHDLDRVEKQLTDLDDKVDKQMENLNNKFDQLLIGLANKGD